MSAPSSTRTTLFGIFVLAGRPLSAAQAIALSRPLGISSNNVKSHLTRMVAQGALRRSGPRRRAVYWPSPGKQHVVRGIAARLEGGPEEAWDGRWIVLTLRMPRSRSERDRLRDALWFDGFRPWDPGTYLRPAWPAKWALDCAAAHLASRSGVCVHGVMLGTVDVTHVGRMYELDSLDRHARRLAGAITVKPQRIRSDSAAFAARLDIGGRVARLVAHDPRLPPTLWNRRTGLRDMVKAYQRFEARVAPRAQRFLDDIFRAMPQPAASPTAERPRDLPHNRQGSSAFARRPRRGSA
jgi:DNA-binding transcriptional regulator PaaX